MKLEMTANDTAAVTSGRAPRCVCCAGVIEISADQDMSLGLNLALGLVSDECRADLRQLHVAIDRRQGGEQAAGTPAIARYVKDTGSYTILAATAKSQ